MKKRLITGTVLACLFLPVLLVEDLFVLFQLMMMILAVIASIEMINMYEKDKKFPTLIKIFIIISTLLIYCSALVEWCPSSILARGAKLMNIKITFLPMLIIVCLLLFGCMVLFESFNGSDIGKALTIVNYVGLGFASITILRAIGLRIIFFLFLVTICTDVFAYVFGCTIGRKFNHKMCPTISPKKTWEGAIGGTAIATIMGTCFGFFYGPLFGDIFGPKDCSTILHTFISTDNLSMLSIFFILLFLTFLASVFSQIGDLVASKLKRTYQIKDFGRIFPGHGGVLDRLDSALFTGMFLLSIFTIITNFLGL